MNLSQILKWAEDKRELMRDRVNLSQMNIESKHHINVASYLEMVIGKARSVLEYSEKAKKYMEDVNEYLLWLDKHGLRLQEKEKDKKGTSPKKNPMMPA